MASYNIQIYLTTNLNNGKIYIGQSNGKDRNYLGSGKLIKEAIKKFGRRNFNKKIIVDNIPSLEEANKLEKFYIKKYNSTNPDVGYNIENGGRGNLVYHTVDSIEKIKARSQQEDNKQLIRNIQKIAANKRIGTHLREDVKINTMITKFKKRRIIEIYNKLGELVNSCNFSSEAANLTNTKKSAVKNVLCGLAQSSAGYTFKYKIL